MRWFLFLVAAVMGAQSPDAWQKKGEDAFRAGKFAESVAAFDEVLKQVPSYSAQHWQRGISLYYAGRFEDCRKQFALHRTVNPEDVENAVFHMLCAARIDGLAKARANLIPITSDTRPGMMQVHALFAGTGTTAQVMNAAKNGGPTGMFYAFLYLGYYEETAGRREASKQYFREANRLAGADYMGDTARVHWKALQEGKLP